MTERSADELNDLSRERFGPRADGYRASALHAAGPDLELLVELAAAGPGVRVLDVATGGGHVALALARTGADVTACDLTPEMLDAAGLLLAEHGCQAAFVVAEASALPFPDESFDVVTCRIAAHHFPDAQAFFDEVARVLVPGGRLGFQDQILPPQPTSAVLVDAFERMRDPSHHQAFSVDGWATLIERAGLEVECSELIDKRHEFAVWTARQDCDDACVERLHELMTDAPGGMREWLEPEYDGPALVAFRNRHIVVLARKPE
ncbi:MAG: class I SAM-dependent methyltransferase [Coriobacteriia bacterium]|nr:class I SAM-dependent methyltransferase [Coriobacteriia bacterium]